MPHALWQLQGVQKLEVTTSDQAGHKEQHVELVLESPGTLKPREYDAVVRDLVNFLVYMGEPAAISRVQTGIVVLFVLTALLLLTWLLKREYWKDVH
jgi:ubiquinol-cytochrome c reductase cytochrome c1 subunit